jgi:N-acetylmuramoyl-L-alanine amidase
LWLGQGDLNSRSVGIELANTGAEPFPEPQMTALETLLAGVMARWDISPRGVIAHSDLAPGRKSDPGARFDWQRLARQGLSVWPDAVGAQAPDMAAFRDAAARIGYALEAGDDAVLAAFRLRFRPMAKGPLNGLDMQLVEAVAKLHVDQTAQQA